MPALPAAAQEHAPLYEAVKPCDEEPLSIKTRGGLKDFTVEVARTRDQQHFGLMYRTALAKGRGMLFLWKADAPVSMWMKNTLISLDMLFIDRHGRIVYIAENTVPESTEVISPGRNVRAVLELAGGAAKEAGIRVGDRVLFKGLGS